MGLGPAMGEDDPRIPAKIIVEILSGYRLPVMGTHGAPHWGRVLENGLRLAAKTGADPEIVVLFAVLHDARRRSEDHDPEHGRRGATLAARLRRHMQLSDARFERLSHACAHHADGGVDGDPTVGTCWDADRLDLWRVGITPKGKWLCTAAARDRDTLAWSRERSLGGHVPGFVAGWLRLAGTER